LIGRVSPLAQVEISTVIVSKATTDLARKAVQSIERVNLDLAGWRVLTEAATGAYAVTPVIAAATGAEVTALTRSTRYGTADEARRQVLELAHELDVDDRIRIVETLTESDIASANVVTNSGHLRPLNVSFLQKMTPGAAIPLMYESWELRHGEVDLEACRRFSIRVAGTNESHPGVQVFDYLGILALFGLFQCRVPVCFSRILLICDNAFAPHIAKTLVDCGAELEVFADTPLPDSIQVSRRSIAEPAAYDAVVVADTPGPIANIGRLGKAKYSVEQIGSFSALAQLWGDVDRTCLEGMMCYPPTVPRNGHMGIMLNEIGPEPVLRLQAGGLKVGEVLLRDPRGGDPLWDYCQRIPTRR
jgi:hypothetical protein